MPANRRYYYLVYLKTGIAYFRSPSKKLIREYCQLNDIVIEDIMDPFDKPLKGIQYTDVVLGLKKIIKPKS